MESELKETAAELKVPIFDVSERTASTLAQMKKLQAQMKGRCGKGVAGCRERSCGQGGLREGGGIPVIIERVDMHDAGGMRNAWDVLRSPHGGAGRRRARGRKGRPVRCCSPLAPTRPWRQGSTRAPIIKAISKHVQGGGGGKPTMAQAGGKSAEGIPARARRGKGHAALGGFAVLPNGETRSTLRDARARRLRAISPPRVRSTRRRRDPTDSAHTGRRSLTLPIMRVCSQNATKGRTLCRIFERQRVCASWRLTSGKCASGWR